MDKMLVDKIKIIRIYIQLDYLFDFFVRQKKTYIAIYILQKYIQTLHLYTAPNIVKHTHTHTHTLRLQKLNKHLQQERCFER